jgi:DNA helicase II / ATP-dependent DNA helicase PcrA
MLEFLNQLNEQQKKAVLQTEGPLMVLAGAGSGKTKMLTSRIAYLIEGRKVLASRILAVTFTNKAAKEMRERVETFLGTQFQGGPYQSSYLHLPEIGTFHSVCVRILRRELIRTPFTKPFVIYDDSDQLSLLKTIVNSMGLDEKTFSPKSIQFHINRAKCDAKEPQDLEIEQYNIFSRQLKRVYEQYQKELFANNALDFGEIICLVYRLLRDNPDLLKKYQSYFQYIHVDEYQDTNRAQYLLLSLLAAGCSGGHQNICVVGDEDQSIYKWRGADIRNILDFEKDFPGAQTVKLEQNYRSTKSILNAANQVIRNNSFRKEKVLWTEKSEGRPVIRAQLSDERAEAEMVISEIKRMAEGDGRTFNDFAIFYRTHAQSRQFEDSLRREKIPYQVVGGLKFYDRKEIKDILAYFRVILNPADSVSLKRIINVPARGIGKTTLEKLDEYYSRQGSDQRNLIPLSLNYWEVLKHAAIDPALTSLGTSKKILRFVEFIERLMTEQPKLLLSELYHLILDETGYVRTLKQENTDESLSRIENLEEFDNLLQEFEEDVLRSLNEGEQNSRKIELLPRFIEQAALASDLEQSAENSSMVKMMTLHSSKGLEFPVAFIVGMEEGLFPSIKAWEETPEEEIEEERRLCYVGMTRAKELLYLVNVIIRRIWGNVSYQEPSRFLSEISDEFLEVRDFSIGSRSQDFKSGSSRHFRESPQPSVAVKPALVDLWIGRQMLHPEYGRGTVVGCEGSGMEQKLTIRFLDRQQRKFLLRYIANLFSQ